MVVGARSPRPYSGQWSVVNLLVSYSPASLLPLSPDPLLSHTSAFFLPIFKNMQPLYWSIEQLPGLNKEEQAKLKACGIDNTKKLLQKTSTLELQ